MNTHLKNDPRPIEDSEQDLVGENDSQRTHPIAPEELRVFPRDEDIPKDQLNTTIDRHFVQPAARGRTPGADGSGAFRPGRERLLAALWENSFKPLPIGGPEGSGRLARRFTPAREADPFASGRQRLETEPGIFCGLRKLLEPAEGPPARILVALTGPEGAGQAPAWLNGLSRPGDAVYLLEPRGCGETRWDEAIPPNTIARSHALVGRTVDAGRLIDAGATAAYLRRKYPADVPIYLAGRGAAGVLAAYATLWDETDIAGAVVIDPPGSHLDPAAPVFMNVLRVADIPEVLGAIAPKELNLIDAPTEVTATVKAWFETAHAADMLTIQTH